MERFESYRAAAGIGALFMILTFRSDHRTGCNPQMDVNQDRRSFALFAAGTCKLAVRGISQGDLFAAGKTAAGDSNFINSSLPKSAKRGPGEYTSVRSLFVLLRQEGKVLFL